MVFPSPIQSAICSVFHVASLVIPAQVFDPVVGRIAVVVTSELMIGRHPVKCHEYKPGNQLNVLFPIDAESNAHVAIPVVLRQDASFVLLGHFLVMQSAVLCDFSWVAVNPAKV